MVPLKRKKTSHATASSSEVHTSNQPPKSSGPPPKITSLTCPANSDFVEITREDERVERVQLNAVVDLLNDDDLHQMISVENRDERSLVSHRALMHRLHGYFNRQDPTLLPIFPEPISVVPLLVTDPTGATYLHLIK
jgi:hypothetical protein